MPGGRDLLLQVQGEVFRGAQILKTPRPENQAGEGGGREVELQGEEKNQAQPPNGCVRCCRMP